jgi:uncharacterized membrane protein
MRDSGRVRDQPALTTSSGRSWLIVGGLFALVCLVVLVALLGNPARGVAIFGIVAVLVLYAGMIVARLTARPGRRRLGIMAACMIALAAVALICVLVIAGATQLSVPAR